LRRSAELTLAIFLVVVASSQALLNLGSRPSASVSVPVPITGSGYQIPYKIQAGSFGATINLAAFPVKTFEQKNLPIYLYYQFDYSVTNSWIPYNMIVTGIYYDLQFEISAASLHNAVKMVNYTQLQEILNNGTVGALIIPTSAYDVQLPPPDISQGTLESWMKGGGAVFWLGAPSEESESFSFPISQTVLSGWDNVSSWLADDVPSTTPSQVHLGFNSTSNSIQISHSNLSAISRGFYGVFDPGPGSLEAINQPNMYLSFEIKVTGLQYATLVYLELKDANGNYAHYYIQPSELVANQWIGVTFALANPNTGSLGSLELNTTRMYFTYEVYPKVEPPGSSAQINIANITLSERVPLVYPSGSLVQASEESPISEALNLTYGYVTSGIDVATLEAEGGTVLGKVATVDNVTLTSIGLIPYGNGSEVIFGNGLYPPYWQSDVARDIVTILASGILDVNGPVTYATYSLVSYGTISGDIRVPAANLGRWVIFSYSPYDWNRIAESPIAVIVPPAT
jgi:hypothetical protein